jgi:hypothetical protein
VQACTPAVILLCRRTDPGQPWRSADTVRWLIDESKQSAKATTNQSETSAQETADHRKTALDCLQQRHKQESPPDNNTDQEFFKQLIPTDLFKETEELPYIPIAYSGFMAQPDTIKGPRSPCTTGSSESSGSPTTNFR